MFPHWHGNIYKLSAHMMGFQHPVRRYRCFYTGMEIYIYICSQDGFQNPVSRGRFFHTGMETSMSAHRMRFNIQLAEVDVSILIWKHLSLLTGWVSASS